MSKQTIKLSKQEQKRLLGSVVDYLMNNVIMSYVEPEDMDPQDTINENYTLVEMYHELYEVRVEVFEYEDDPQTFQEVARLRVVEYYTHLRKEGICYE